MKKGVFHRIFPPPKFLQMRTAGLDISDHSIRYVNLIDARNGFKIASFGARRVPDGTIESGEVKDIDGLVKAFNGLKADLGTAFVNVSLPEERAYIVKLRTPRLKRAEIRTGLDLQLSEHVPLSSSEAVFDYDLLGNQNKKRRGYLDVALSVMPRSSVEKYLAFLSRIKLLPMAFEIEAQATARAVIPKGDQGTFMIVDLGETRTGISVVEREVVVLSSSVNIGGQLITVSIQKALSVSFEEAERIKIEKGLTGGKQDDRLFPAIMSVVAALRDEIGKHFMYWHTHKDQDGESHPPIEKIILCGGNAPMHGLGDYLSSGLSMEAELANVMVNIRSLDEYIPDINFNESLRYATAIGLALRDIS